MESFLARFFADLAGRLTGPLTMRLFLQPIMASIFGIRDGLRDAKDGRPPHLHTILRGTPEQRRRRLKETWVAVMKIFILAIVLDFIYQLIVFRWIYLGETVVVAVILAFIPYVIVRGLTGRIARRWHAGRGTTASPGDRAGL
jgi:hypothetical protein